MSGISRRALLGTTAAGVAAISAPALLTKAFAADTVRIGAAFPLTGPAELIGRNLKIGAEIARDQINAAGGVLGKPIELVFFDERAQPAQAVAALRELSGNGVNLIAGLPITTSASAAMPLLATNNAALIITGSTALQTTHDWFTRNAFRISDSGYAQANALAKIVTERHPDIRRWSSIFPDAASGHGSYKMFSSQLVKHRKSAGLPDPVFLDPRLTKAGATDFKSQIIHIMSDEPEGLFNVVYGGDGVTMFQQMKVLGLSEKLKVVVDMAMETDLAIALKENIPANTWSFTHGHFDAHTDVPLAAQVKEEARKRSGDTIPSNFVGLMHSAIVCYAAAIAKAKSTETAAVIEALETSTFPTIKGPMTFRKEDHSQISTIDLINIVRTGTAPGWQVREAVKVPTESVIEPPTPGSAFTL